jgi:CDP-glucose 4,6-dehydratase
VADVVSRSAFWRGRRVLLTGHTGFKGGWLALWLQRMGAEVHGLALPPETDPSFFETCRVAEGMTSRFGDIRDLRVVLDAAERSSPEIVIHMAAQPLVRRSYDEPVETFATNVMGTVHVLEAARRTRSVRAVVAVTSDKCYSNREWVWGYRETDPLGGHDPYSASKGCSEIVAASYRSAFPGKALIATVRAGNVIGGGDWSKDRLIPDLVRAAERGEPALVRNPNAIRPWQHVLEPLRGYLDVAQRLVEQGAPWAEAWNFGPAPSDARPVHWIADRIVAAWGSGARWERDGAPAPHEATFLRLDCGKANARLDWWPRWSLDAALQRIVAWHRAHRTGTDMRAFSLGQIGEYETAADETRR